MKLVPTKILVNVGKCWIDILSHGKKQVVELHEWNGPIIEKKDQYMSLYIF